MFNLSAKHAEGILTGDIITGLVPIIRHGWNTPHCAVARGDRFEVGDQIRITSPHTSGHAIMIAPSPSRTDEQGDESIAAFCRAAASDHHTDRAGQRERFA